MVAANAIDSLPTSSQNRKNNAASTKNQTCHQQHWAWHTADLKTERDAYANTLGHLFAKCHR